MITFDDYRDRYEHIRLAREDGILTMTLHTEGRELRWGLGPHEELPEALSFIRQDRENRILILTGTGSEFSGPKASASSHSSFDKPPTPLGYDKIYSEGKALISGILDLEIPIICAVNGPAVRHAEIPLLCDIVLASEDAVFQDSAHFVSGIVPGDGVHLVYPLLMGMNRGRYFLLTGHEINAAEAKDLGLVNEVLPRDDLMMRARELAIQLNAYPQLHLRYSRVAINELLRRMLSQGLGYGLILEGMALQERHQAIEKALT